MQRPRRDYRPIHWSKYFDESLDIRVNDTDTFRVYTSNLGQSNTPDRPSTKPIVVLLHGGGYSSLTWALFAKEMRGCCDCGILAIDLRGHGCTQTSNDEDLSIETLVNDVERVTSCFYERQNNDSDDPQETPNIVLVGHSMGGAIAVKCAAKSSHTFLPSLMALVVIDVVEGTAIDALQGMQSVLRARPRHFATLENAIEWSVRSAMTRNSEAASVSMPGNLISLESKKLAIFDVSKELMPNASEKSGHGDTMPSRQSIHSSRSNNETNIGIRKPLGLGPILEGPPRDDDAHHIARVKREPLPRLPSSPTSSIDHSGFKNPSGYKDDTIYTTGYIWRTDLMKTQSYWNAWFTGLSNDLLNAPIRAKLLLLAGIDRLDKDLTIGQMQGKFMMRVLPKSGHAVQEDVPDQVSEVIANFLIRNKLVERPSD